MGTVNVGPRFKGKVITESGPLNIRLEASTNAQTVGTLARNGEYWFHAEDHTNDPVNPGYCAAWLACSDGYVSAQYVAWDPSLGTNGHQYTFVNVSSGYLNLRKTPSSSATVIGRLYDDEELLWLNYEYGTSEWAHVATPVGTGWVKKSYLDNHG